MLRRVVGAQILQKTFMRYVLPQTMCTINKDVAKVDSTLAPDFLLQNLKNAETANKVLQLIASHHKIMNKNHVMQALKMLFVLQKGVNTNMSTEQIRKHPDFEKICSNLRSQVGSLEPNDVIDALKLMTFLGVPSNSTVVQVLLQMLRHSINQLSLKQIIFSDFLISQQQSTPLGDALKIALPIVFQIQLPMQIDRTNIVQLTEYFQYISKNKMSEETIETIVKALEKCPTEMDGKLGVSIVWSITDMPTNEFFQPLLEKAMNAIAADVDRLNYNDIETTISKLINRISHKNSVYFNETFFDVACNYIIDNDSGFDMALYLQRKLNKIDYANVHLLDYISQKLTENPDLLLMGNVASKVCNLCIAYAFSNYRPKDWDVIQQIIENALAHTINSSKDVLWLKFAASLTVLNVFDEEILTKVLERNFLNTLLSRKFRGDAEHLLYIYQAIKVYKPEFIFLLPPQEIIDNIIKNLAFILDPPLEKALQKALGGESYVQSKVMSRLGHRIDHVIKYRKGGYPVAFTKQYEFIEDIEVTEDTQMILVLALLPVHYTIDGRRLKGYVDLSVRTLEAMGFPVAAICLEGWSQLPDFEKIPYLMRSIKEKLPSIVNMHDNSIV